MQLHPKILQGIRQVAVQWPALPQATKIPARLQQTIVAFCAHEANRDGRGLRREALRTVERTLKHIRSAERVAANGAAAGDLAHKARSLLKSLQHNTKFESTVEQARQFVGQMQRDGKRRKREAAVCRQKEHSCGTLEGVGEVHVRRVVSVDELKSVGRSLRLCVGKNDEMSRDYASSLREQRAEFWTLRASSRPFALLRIEEVQGSRSVIEFQGLDNSDPTVIGGDGRCHEVPPHMLRKLLKFLDADASEVQTFTRAGVFRSLLSDASLNAYSEVSIAGKCYRVWKFPCEIIILSWHDCVEDHNSVGERWSRFIRTEPDPWLELPRRRRARRERRWTGAELAGWQEGELHGTAMEVGQVLELLLRSPELYDIFAGVGRNFRARDNANHRFSPKQGQTLHSERNGK